MKRLSAAKMTIKRPNAGSAEPPIAAKNRHMQQSRRRIERTWRLSLRPQSSWNAVSAARFFRAVKPRHKLFGQQ
jgi:hypothetical protein